MGLINTNYSLAYISLVCIRCYCIFWKVYPTFRQALGRRDHQHTLVCPVIADSS